MGLYYNILSIVNLMSKKKWYILGGVILLILLVLPQFFKKKEPVYTTAKALEQTIRQSVEVTGQVESADDIQLNFKNSGLVRTVNVKVGDKVKSGQLLAALRADNVGAQIADAQAAVDIAQSDLDKLLAGASSADLNITQEEVNSANLAYQTALSNLVDLESTRDRELANLKATAINAINEKVSVAQYALDIVEDAIIDSDADYYLYVFNQSTFSAAKVNYATAKNSLDNFYVVLGNNPDLNNQEVLLATLDNLDNVLNQTLVSVNTAFDTMLVTIENSTYTNTVIASFKTSLNTQSAALSTAISAVQTASANLRTKDLYYQNQIISSNNSIQAALKSLDLAKAKLAYKKEPPRDFQIASAQANVRRAQANLNRYYSELGDSMIKAPVDGTVTKVNIDPGEISSLSNFAISMIGVSNLQVEVDVPESDITKLTINDPVEITLDAFSSTDKFAGVISFIDPAATVINEVIYYKVKVSLNEQNELIKSGMTADLAILTEQKDKALVIPSRAVVYKNDKAYVQVLVNNQPQEKEVEVGLKGDDSLVEILSGLQVAEEVITFTTAAK